jgi:hypothetical protein
VKKIGDELQKYINDYFKALIEADGEKIVSNCHNRM